MKKIMVDAVNLHNSIMNGEVFCEQLWQIMHKHEHNFQNET